MTNASPIEFRLERSDSRTQPYFFRVCETDGAHLAYSETYESRESVNAAVGVVKKGHTEYVVFQGQPEGDGGKRWWFFHIKALNNRILARSAFKYATERGATAAKELVRNNAADARYVEYTGERSVA